MDTAHLVIGISGATDSLDHAEWVAGVFSTHNEAVAAASVALGLVRASRAEHEEWEFARDKARNFLAGTNRYRHWYANWQQRDALDARVKQEVGPEPELLRGDEFDVIEMPVGRLGKRVAN